MPLDTSKIPPREPNIEVVKAYIDVFTQQTLLESQVITLTIHEDWRNVVVTPTFGEGNRTSLLTQSIHQAIQQHFQLIIETARTIAAHTLEQKKTEAIEELRLVDLMEPNLIIERIDFNQSTTRNQTAI